MDLTHLSRVSVFLLATAFALPSGVAMAQEDAGEDVLVAEAEGDVAPEPEEEPAEPTRRQAAASRSGSDAEAPEHAVVIEGAMRVDLHDLQRYSRTNRDEQRDNESSRELGGMIYLGFLRGLSEHLMIGAGFGFGGQIAVEDGRDDIVLGQLLYLDVRVQLQLPIQDKLDVIVFPRLGVNIIAPQGELRDQIDDARNRGFNTWRGPRLGILGGVDAGVRYMINQWLGVRGTFGYAYSWSPLLRSSASSSFASGELEWTHSSHRIRVAVGFEAHF